MGVMPALPIRIGRLELKIDTMVTAADSYNILIGNDWLRMAQADLLLSKGQLRIRLDAEQWEEIPLDVNQGHKRLSVLISTDSPTPQPRSLLALATLVPRSTAAVSSNYDPAVMRQSTIRAEDIPWRRFPELPIITVTNYCYIPVVQVL